MSKERIMQGSESVCNEGQLACPYAIQMASHRCSKALFDTRYRIKKRERNNTIVCLFEMRYAQPT